MIEKLQRVAPRFDHKRTPKFHLQLDNDIW